MTSLGRPQRSAILSDNNQQQSPIKPPPNVSATTAPIPRSYGYFSVFVKMHFGCLLVDLFISTFAERGKHNIYLLIGLYALQLILIIANLMMLFIEFTNTQPFRAGLLRLLVNCGCCGCSPLGPSNPIRWIFGSVPPNAALPTTHSKVDGNGVGNAANRGDFNAAVWWTVLYFLIATATRVYGVLLMWGCADSGAVCDPWSSVAFRVLFVFFRIGSIGYYYYFRRAILAICDPKYYKTDSEWLQKRLRELHHQ